MDTNGRKNARDNSRAGFEKREKRRQIRALQEAIDKHDIDTVEEILQDKFDVDFQYRSQTALQLAVKEESYDICQLLINNGANVNMADAEQNNLLNMACWRGYTKIAELLVKHSANIDDQNIYGLDAVHTCALKDCPDILQILIASGADLDNANLTGQSALHTAVKEQNMEIVQLLVLGGCIVDKTDEHRRTPLMFAAELGYADIAKLLINGGSNLNKQDKTGSTPLFIAVSNGQLNVVQELVQAEADINLPSTKGSSPLLASINGSHTDISLYLIQAGCDVNQSDRLSQAPIHSAVTSVSQVFMEETAQAMVLIRSLVDAGCDLNKPNQHGERPLYQSACGGNTELTDYLLTKDVDLTVTTNTGDTILHASVHGNKPQLVHTLAKAGCALNKRNNAGQHALLTAVMYHANIQIIETLVEAGSDLDIRDKDQCNTALHNTIVHYYRDAALLLIQKGCDVNALNVKKHSPLYVACELNDENVAKAILDSEIFNRKLFQHPSIPQPLFAAVGNNHVNLIDLLLKAGCDINMVNVDGLSPVQYAIQENCPFVTKFLLKHNCDLDAHAKVRRLFKCCLTHDDRHPHFDLEPLFLALTHKRTDMLEIIIKCYWKVPTRILRMLDKVFLSTPDLSEHYSPELRVEIHRLFQRSVKEPQSLQDSCRAVVRQRLGACLQTKVESFPIANKLKAFILMDEFFGDLQEKIEQTEKKHPTDFHGFRSYDDAF